MEHEELRRRAGEVEVWCARLRAAGRGLFGPELSPRRGIGDVFTGSVAWPGMAAADRAEIVAMVDEVCSRRRAFVNGACAVVEPHALVYVPEWADFSELAAETGMVDEADAPAPELWIGTGEHEGRFCVVAHVPEWWRGEAERACGMAATGAVVLVGGGW